MYMKTILPITLCLCAAPVVAQLPVESADQRSHVTSYSRVAWSEPGRWAFLGLDEDEPAARSFLMVIDPTGNTLLDAPIGVSGVPIEGSVLLALPDGHLAAGALIECDLPTGNAGGIVRVDAAGQEVWHLFTPLLRPSSASVSPSGVLAFGDGPVSWPPTVLVLNADGTGPVEWTSPWPLMRTVRWLVEDTLVVLHDARLARFTRSGTLVDDRALLPGAIGLEVLGANDVRVLFADRLVRYDGTLTAMDSVSFASHAPAWGLKRADGALWVMAAAHFLRIDPVSGAVAAIANEPLDSLTVRDVAVAEGLVMTAGVAEISGRKAGVMRSCSTDGTFARHGIDVSLELVSLDSVEFEVLGMANELVRVRAQATLRLRNEGTLPVDEVLVNTQDYFFAICGLPGRSFPLAGLSLAPGDSVDIVLPPIRSDIFYYPPGSTVRWPLCFVAISPNLLVDRVPANNETCREIVGINDTGIGEGPTFGTLSCLPNPFSDRVTIHFGSPTLERGELMVFDARGVEVHRSVVAAGTTQWPVDLAALAPGTYTARITSAGGHGLVRMMKMP